MATEEGPALPSLQALHKKLLGQLTNILSSPVTSSRERIVAVAGIGELAAPTRRFFGQQVWHLLCLFQSSLFLSIMSLQSPRDKVLFLAFAVILTQVHR